VAIAPGPPPRSPAAATTPPRVTLSLPLNGDVGGISTVVLSLPLITANLIGVPGPVTRIVSAIPSPLTSALAVRTFPVNPPNGVRVAAGVVLNWPPAAGVNTWADPFVWPDA